MTDNTSHNEARIIAILRQFLQTSGNPQALQAVTLEADLERDLGIDSLGRVELFKRLEQAFHVQFQEADIANIVTLKDLLEILSEREPSLQLSHKRLIKPLQATQVDPSQANSLLDVLFTYAEHEPDRPHIYMQDDTGQEHVITYGDLLSRAGHVAQGLSELGLQPGETVAIMLPTSEDFFYAFTGIQLAGGVPVPIYPPFRPDKIEEYVRREARILHNADVRILITFHAAKHLSRLLKSFIPSLIAVTTVKQLLATPGKCVTAAPSRHDPAMIQYTSGSTSDPKGVLLSHGNLISNIQAVADAVHMKATDVGVSWLPLYHDMGLIGAWMNTMYNGIPVTIMSPLAFLARPERWLWTIHYHRGTISGGPNFAYELCVQRLDKADLQGLDLSCWRIAFNGAEAINPATLARFTKKFAPYGFKPESLFPVYGLAESAVALCVPPVGRVPRIDKVDRDVFQKNHLAKMSTKPAANDLHFVACGKPLPGHQIRVVNDLGKVLEERQVGNLQFAGPSTMQGYYRNPQATHATMHDAWVDTGDLAYIADGELFVTGRKKDVIIKAGRNIYPDEIEALAAHVSGIRKGCCIAFGVPDTEQGTEKLCLVAETRVTDKKSQQVLMATLQKQITAQMGIAPDHIILVPPKTIPKTSSGKLQRSACKQQYLAGALHKAPPVWWQVTKLLLRSSLQQLKRVAITVSKAMYTGYVWLVVPLTAMPLWLSLFITTKAQAKRSTRCWARLIFRLLGISVKVQGRIHLETAGKCIYVANHCSYLDAVVLAGILPDNVAFVGKEELRRWPFVRTFVNKLGHLTVNRFEVLESIADSEKISQSLAGGRAMVIFPEGTMTEATGLRPFKFGAFNLASETHTPICPIAIKGTRRVFPAGHMLLSPGKVTVTVCPLSYPQDRSWESAAQARGVVRDLIAKYCGEAKIDLVRAGPEV
ncbi:MAG: acyl-CoA synthetase [Legionellales bacterium]|nr:acyl-CoA synthetase [Legionellales bacterium]|tara:strand:+ start:6916 stop:9720 length:2805 start_codon:yes stop_codon:yes gene_type:complete